MNRGLARARWIPRLRAAALVIAALGVALLLDPLAWRLLRWRAAEGEEWYQVLRQFGYLPTWLAIAACFALHDRRVGPPRPSGLAVEPSGPARLWHHRGGLLALSAVLSGLAAELGKMTLGRARPDPETGELVYRGLFSGFVETSNLGGPSSHAAVAWGGALMLGWLLPATRPVVWTLAAGCALTRLWAGAHAFSGVVAGSLVALAVAGWLWRTGRGPRRGPAGGLVRPV